MSKLVKLLLLGSPLLWAQLPAPVPVIGWPATDPGDGAAALLTPISASSMALAADGTILYAETGRIRRIDSAGKIRTVVTDTRLSAPVVAVDSAGAIYYTAVNPASVMEWTGIGTPVRIAGGGTSAAADGVTATNANVIAGWIAISPSGSLFFSERLTFRVYRVDSGGILRAVAGTGTSGTAGEGSAASAAQLAGPGRIGFDSSGNLYLEDSTANGIRLLKIDATGTLTRVANPSQYAGGFSVGQDGSIYYSSTITNALNRLAPGGATSQVTVTSGMGFEGCGPGPFAPQPFAAGELQVTPDSRGLLVLMRQPFSTARQKILHIDNAGAVTLVAGGPDEFSGDGGPASAAGIFNPTAVVADAAGDVFIGDAGNHRVRKVMPDGTIQTIAGSGPASSTVYCKPPATGYLAQITGLTIDSAGTLYIADQGANIVWRKATGGAPAAFAGNGQSSKYGAATGSVATAVALDSVGPVALDSNGNVWVVSNSNGLVKIGASGVILDIVPLISPRSITADPSGTVYATTNERVYRIAADDSLVPVSALAATPSVLVGPGPSGSVEYTVGIPTYSGPAGLAAAVDGNGTVYFVASNGIETVSRGCVAASASATPPAVFNAASFDPAGGIYLSDSGGNRIWQMAAAPTTGQTSVGLGPAPVRSLGSGIVLQNPISFAAGGDGMGLTFYQFISDTVAPGELVRISGTCLGPMNPVDTGYDAAGDVPVALGGAQVLFDGTPSPLVSVVSGEIVAVTPYELAGKSTTNMSVMNANGQASVKLNVAPAVPGLFHLIDALGTDSVVALNSDGSRNTRTSPAAAGSIIALYATGLGQTNPASVDGMMRAGDRQMAAQVTVQINNVNAPVLYAGPAPGFVGLEQINVQVPAAATGAVVLAVGGTIRPLGAVLWIAK